MLHSSQVSKLRNAQMATPFLKAFEGVEACNHAIWAWHQDGAEATRRRLGPLPSCLLATDLDAATWLFDHRSANRAPLSFCGLVEVFAGRLVLPYVEQTELSPSDAKAFCDALSDWLDQWCASHGGLRAGFRLLEQSLAGFPPERVTWLRRVVTRDAEYIPGDLVEELELIVAALNATVEEPRSEYQWLRELLRRRDGDGPSARPLENRRRPGPNRA